MKIALIEPVGGHGGMDFYAYGLAQGLGKNQVNVLYFTSEETKIKKYRLVETCHNFKKVWSSNNNFLRLYYFLKGYYASFKKAKQEKVERVHFHFFDLGGLNFFVVLLSFFFNFKKILTLHDVSSFKRNNENFVSKFILNRFDKIIVHNNFSYFELSKKLKEPRKIHIVPHGNYLPFVQNLTYFPKEKKPLQLLFFGQIKEVKGLEILLKSLGSVVEKNPNIHLTIAGKPWHDAPEKYNNLIQSLRLSKHVTTIFEYIENDAVSEYFKKTDLVILPYKKIYQSGVLLLSMSYGRAVLASNLLAFEEIVEHKKTGLLFESENQLDLAEKILEAAENKNSLRTIAENATAMLNAKFDWENIGNETKKIYRSIRQ